MTGRIMGTETDVESDRDRGSSRSALLAFGVAVLGLAALMALVGGGALGIGLRPLVGWIPGWVIYYYLLGAAMLVLYAWFFEAFEANLVPPEDRAPLIGRRGD